MNLETSKEFSTEYRADVDNNCDQCLHYGKKPCHKVQSADIACYCFSDIEE